MGCRSTSDVIAYPNNCKKYLICELNRGKIVPCLTTEVYSNVTKSCVDEKTAKCNIVPGNVISMDPVAAGSKYFNTKKTLNYNSNMIYFCFHFKTVKVMNLKK